MWAMTTDGFFSVVKDRFCKKGEVMVRTRLRMDLTAFRRKMDLKTEILELHEADYRFRIPVKAHVWAKCLAAQAEAIDYPNFKAAVPVRDRLRHAKYMQCWSALREMQD